MVKKNVPATTPANSRALAKMSAQSLMASDARERSGFENMGADDIALPFILVLQALSPQLRGTTKIKGADEGDFFNTATGEIYKDKIIIVPCAYQKLWVEWSKREDGGGFVRQHSSADILDHTTKDEKNRNVLANGNHIVDTAYHYCLLIKPDGRTERIVLAFTSTQLKKSRRWNSQMISLQLKVGDQVITPPMFSHTYSIETIEESNDQGSWAGLMIGNPVLIEDVNLYTAARKFHLDVMKGSVKTSLPPEATAPSLVSSSTAGPVTTEESDVF
jgi:hypothetical protein